MICWGCGGIGHGRRECATPRLNNYLPFKPETSSPLPTSTKGSHHYQTTDGRFGVLMKLQYHNPNSGVRIWGRAKESEIEIDRWERKHH